MKKVGLQIILPGHEEYKSLLLVAHIARITHTVLLKKTSH